ncbi:MAG: sulfotransferase [Pseudomonadota bacterium]
MTDKRFIFVIGFNRCGTLSLHQLFTQSGIRSLHQQADDSGVALAMTMALNLSVGRPLIAGLARFEAFLGMSYVAPDFVFEGCRLFWQLHAEHPDSYFILNTRPIEHWVDSRQFFNGGEFADDYADVLGYEEIKTQQVWRKQYLGHVAEVREHFAEHGGNFLEFDIENDDPTAIQDFLAPDFRIDPTVWGHWNATDFDALAEEVDA